MTVTIPDDSRVVRNRNGRYAVLGVSAIALVAGGAIAGYTTAQLLFHNSFVSWLSALAFGGLSTIFGGTWLWEHSIIHNRTTRAFVTIDRLRSFLGKPNVNVTYGPGTHVCYWWEYRHSDNNVNLEEAAQDFTFQVACKNGVLYGQGSFRLRPDLESLVPFLTGVAAMAAELSDLVVAKIAPKLAKVTIEKGAQMIEELNHDLEALFVTNKSAFETRFGVDLGDITIKQLLPSDNVKKTLAGLAEADAVAKGTALLLGMGVKAVQQALKDGTLPRADYNIARDRFLSISGNLEGMEINRNEYTLTISGLDPEAAASLAKAASAYAAAVAPKTGTKPKGAGANRKVKPKTP